MYFLLLIVYTANWKKQLKKIDRKKKEEEIYNKIVNRFELISKHEEVLEDFILKMYKFESLKYDMSGYYSINLNKNGGTIRLIIKIDKYNNKIIMEYITVDHYKDFKRYLKT